MAAWGLPNVKLLKNNSLKDLGFRFEVLGFRVEDEGFRVYGLGFRTYPKAQNSPRAEYSMVFEPQKPYILSPQSLRD